MCYWKQMSKKRKELGDTALSPVMIVFFLFMYSITCPMNYSDMGHLFFYPLYSDYSLQCLYTSGTWLWVYTIIWIMAHISNDKFNDTIYKYVTGSSMYAYLSHYFFILLISVMIVRPYKITFIPALFLMFFGCQLMIMMTYIPLNWLWELAFPPKETKKMDLSATPEEQEAAKAAQQKANLKADAIEGKENAAIDLEADNQDKASNTSEIKEEKKFE